jgi:branched-chain amino acid transport system ATP-binding protein
MLQVEGLDFAYGELPVLHGVSLSVDAGELVSVIGPNGAGKTTLLRTISGLQPPGRGSVRFEGRLVNGLPPHVICEHGLVQVPEGRLLFPTMSVLENLEMGAYGRRARAALRDSLERVCALFPVLAERQRQEAGTLSGGEQQMLAVGRALMSGPRLLMLDEPSLGLSPRMAAAIFAVLERLNREGLAILLVSQEVVWALRIARRAFVLETGRIVLSGAGADLLRSERVTASYLGI